MSSEIETHRIQKFTEGITILAQQRMSRLRSRVRNETVKAKNAFFDQITSTVMQEKTTRHTDTPLIEVPHRRRYVDLKFYHTADLIGDMDLNQVLNDPSSSYSRVMAMAAGRQYDQTIIDAFFASAKTGETGSGPAATFPGTAAHDIAAGGVGLTVDKILDAKQILDSTENDPSFTRHAITTARQVTDLLKLTEATSSDFNTVRALVRGEIDSWIGFMFERTELLGTNGANIRACPFYCQESMLLAIGIDVKGRVSERADKDYDKQIYYSMRVGATRMEEDGVVRVNCDET